MEYYNNEATPQEMPMKWYKFIIYFQLFVSAMSYLFMGVTYFSFLRSKNVFNLYYLLWESKMKMLDTVMGVLSFATMAFMLYTRHCLTMYKKGAPKKYLFCLALAIINAVVYTLGIWIVTGAFSMATEDIMMLVEAGVLLALNYVYFKKREHLFVY